jgi:DNA-binding HxlR family transcriptional regulator
MKNNKSCIEPYSGCVATAMAIIGSKWTALILRDLADGSRRFSELERSLVGISPKTLSQRLDELERHNIVTKKSYNEVPPRIEYTLTDKGTDLIPLLRQMASWGNKYYDSDFANL